MHAGHDQRPIVPSIDQQRPVLLCVDFLGMLCKDKFLVFCIQGRFGTEQVDADELRDSEDGASALGEMVESLLDDLLEKVDASLDRARAQLRTQPSGAPASDPPAAEVATLGASLVRGGAHGETFHRADWSVRRVKDWDAHTAGALGASQPTRLQQLSCHAF